MQPHRHEREMYMERDEREDWFWSWLEFRDAWRALLKAWRAQLKVWRNALKIMLFDVPVLVSVPARMMSPHENRRMNTNR